MMKHYKLRGLIAVLLLIALTVSASAKAPDTPLKDGWPERENADCPGCPEETPATPPDSSLPALPPKEDKPSERPTETPTETPGKPLTPDGNMTLHDDLNVKSESNKQFLTVTTKDGNYFYIIVDRDDQGNETVHFLNKVDEEDLMGLIEDDPSKEEQPPVCICQEHCSIGHINTKCEVCSVNIGDCAGLEPKPEPEEPPEEPKPEPPAEEPEHEKSGSLAPILVVVILAVVGGGGFVVYKEIIRPKKNTRPPDDLDDEEYEFESEEETEHEETEA